MSIDADQAARRSMSIDMQRRESLDKSRMSIGTSSQDNVLKIDESEENVDISVPQEKIPTDKNSQDEGENKDSATANVSHEAQNNIELDHSPQQQVEINDEVKAETEEELKPEPEQVPLAAPAPESVYPSESEQPVESASTPVKPELSVEAEKPVEPAHLSEPERMAESEKSVESTATEQEAETLEPISEFTADKVEDAGATDVKEATVIASTEEASPSESQNIEDTNRTTESTKGGNKIVEASQKEAKMEAKNDVTEEPKCKDGTNEDAKDVKKNDQEVTEVGAKSDIKQEITSENNIDNSNNEENSNAPPKSTETENSNKTTKSATNKAKSKNQKKKNKKGKK